MSGEITDLKNTVGAFCEARDWDQFHDIKELAIGVSTESSELLEIFRFLSKEQCESLFDNSGKREKIEDELADVLLFLLRISGRYNVDLKAALIKKMAKNAVKYPVEKARGSNRKYNEF
jgi:NTP pyrophosphatase (non-canonical NTP hydrolase)